MVKFFLGAAVAAVVFVYTFFATSGHFDWQASEWPQNYYAMLADSFRSGRVDLNIPPDPQLLAMPNPYDLRAREAAKMPFPWDASLYKEKFYLYFSALPVLLVHLPVKLATGLYPPEWPAGVLFATAMFFTLVALWLFLLKENGVQLKAMHVPWVLVFGLSGLTVYSMIEVSMYTEAILLAAFFLTAMSALLIAAQYKKSLWLVSLAGAAAGLALTVRPITVPAVTLVSAVLLFSWPLTSWHLRRYVIYAGSAAPFLLVQGIYNKVRFDSFFEFGIRYQLTLFDMNKKFFCAVPRTADELDRYGRAFYAYLLNPPFVSRYFPYFFAHYTPAEANAPEIRPYVEQLLGALYSHPLVYLCGAVAVFGVRRGNMREPWLRSVLVLGVAGFLSVTCVSLCGLVTNRYLFDGSPFVMVAGVVALSVFLRECAGKHGLQWLVLGACLVVTYMFGILPGFSGPSGWFERHNPALIQWARERLWLLRWPLW